MIVKQSRAMMLVMGVGCLAAAWGMDYLSYTDFFGSRGGAKLGGGAWIFGALGCFALAKALFMRALVADIRPDGLFAPSISSTTIAWRDISAINAYKAAGSESLAVELVAGSPASQNAKASAKLGKAVTSATGYHGYTLALGTTGVSAQMFLQAVKEAMTGQPQRRTSSPITRHGGFGKRQQI